MPPPGHRSCSFFSLQFGRGQADVAESAQISIPWRNQSTSQGRGVSCMLGNAGAVNHPIKGPLSYMRLSTSVVTLLSQMPQPTIYHF